MYPSGFALQACRGAPLAALHGRGRVGEPGDLGRDACAVRQGVEDAFADMLRAADAIEKLCLEKARNSEGGRGKRDAEGWVRPDEQVLH